MCCARFAFLAVVHAYGFTRSTPFCFWAGRCIPDNGGYGPVAVCILYYTLETCCRLRVEYGVERETFKYQKKTKRTPRRKQQHSGEWPACIPYGPNPYEYDPMTL